MGMKRLDNAIGHGQIKLFYFLVQNYCQNRYIENLGCLIFLHESIMSEIGFSGDMLYHAGDAARKAFLLLKLNYLYDLANP